MLIAVLCCLAANAACDVGEVPVVACRETCQCDEGDAPQMGFKMESCIECISPQLTPEKQSRHYEIDDFAKRTAYCNLYKPVPLLPRATAGGRRG